MSRPKRDSDYYDALQFHLSQALRKNDLALVRVIKKAIEDLVRMPADN